MWVHYAEPETRAQSKQWKPAGTPPTKKLKLPPSAGKVMLVVLGFTQNNTGSFHAKRSNCDC